MITKDVWESCQIELRRKLNPHNYDSWIAPISYVGFEDNTVTLAVPSTFFIDWIEEHYKGQILEIFGGATGNQVVLKLAVRHDKEPEKPTAQSPATPAGREAPAYHDLLEKACLNEKHTFKNFVVGKSNEFCHASCKAVSNNLGKVYNPLFIYGGVGLGKTHLLQAIGAEALKKNPHAGVMYMTSEKFVNSMINALQQGAMAGFRKKYRSLDVLLVDDIQFIAGKERTQEEFFHTFNTLYEMKKQIVVSSDKIPKDMKNMEERLRSRFAWGLIADIQPPELEIKIAILKKIALRNGFTIDEVVAAYLAGKIKSNIRELEGSLSRVMAYSSLTNRPIDMELAQETIKGIYGETNRSVDSKQIQKTVADYYSLKISDLKAKSRSKNVALPRHVAIYLCREFTSSSLPEIGQNFGGRDHTTVIHAVSKIKKEIEVNTKLYNEITEIKRILDL
jgi:chromosomal replication initiator protein